MMTEKKEFLSENELPANLPQEEEKEPFVPSSKSKRVFAWILFVIVLLGIVTWLLNIAYPMWIEQVRAWVLARL